MHKVREILRLMLELNLKDREIAQSCSVSHMTVNNYRAVIKNSELSYSQLSQMSDANLRELLKCKKGRKKQEFRPQPDFEWIHRERQKKGVTMGMGIGSGQARSLTPLA